MKFSQLESYTTPKLLVTHRHEAWLLANRNRTYSDQAIAFMQHQLTKHDRVRKATYSASSLGNCSRQQQFVFLGLPQGPLSTKKLSIFHNGDYMHLRWQMAGLSAGWLKNAEVPIPENEWGLSGTMDGVLDDGSILELKSINDNGFSGIRSFGVQYKHKIQGAAYMLATDAEKISFIYENKNNQDYIEIVHDRNDLKEELDKADKSAQTLWHETAVQRLVDPLNKCLDREGFDYNYCPFKDECLGIKDWDDAVRQAR